MTDSTIHEINLSALARAIARSWLKVAVVSGLIGVAVYAALSTFNPVYTSEVQLKVVGRSFGDSFRQVRGTENQATSGSEALSKEALATQVNVIQSKDFASIIVDEFELEKREEFNSHLSEPGLIATIKSYINPPKPSDARRIKEKVLNAFLKALDVRHIRNTRVISVSVTTESPELSADIANRIGEHYLASQKQQAVRNTKSAGAWLAKEIKRLREEVGAAGEKVAEFRARTRLFTGASEKVSLDAAQLSELNEAVIRARTLKSDARARVRIIREAVENGDADALPEVVESPLIRRLIEQRVQVERRIAELSASLLPAHPRMRQLRSDLAGSNTQIRNEIQRVIRGLEKQEKLAEIREAEIQDSIQKAEQKVIETSANEVQLRKLEREENAKRETLEYYLARHNDATSRQNENAAPIEAEIISHARPPLTPSFPRKVPMVLIALIGTALIAFGWIATREVLRATDPQGGRAKIPSELAGRTRQRMMMPQPGHAQQVVATQQVGAVPDTALRAASPQTARQVPGEIESLRAIADAVLEKPYSMTGSCTLICASQSNLNVEAEAAWLAEELAETGATILMLDLGEVPVPARRHGGSVAARGIWDVTAGHAKLGDVVHALDVPTIQMIGPGRSVQRRAQKIKQNLRLVLDAVKTSYDHVLVFGRGQMGDTLEHCVDCIDQTIVVRPQNTTVGKTQALNIPQRLYKRPDSVFHHQRSSTTFRSTDTAA